MNIELDEVVVLDVSDEALELAAGGAQGGNGERRWSYGGWCLNVNAARSTGHIRC